jgi:vancomycin resistance protein VanJ
MRRERPDATSRVRGVIVGVVLAVVPWAWFLLRDLAPLLDLVAVVLPVAGAVAVVVFAAVAVLRRSPAAAMVALSVAAFTVVAVEEPRAPVARPAPQAPLHLVSANVYENNPEPEAAAAALLRDDADVLAVIEAEPAVTDGLDAAYAHNIDHDHIAIHSRYPAHELPSGASIRHQIVIRARVWGPGGPFILYVIHQLNPLYDAAFAEQTDDLQAFIDRASSERQPVVLAGDFNMTDRSRGYRLLSASFADAMRSGARAGSTYDHGLWAPLFLRIDHIFTESSWCAAGGRALSLPGSDHQAIAVDVGPCPGTPIRASRGPTATPTP